LRLWQSNFFFDVSEPMAIRVIQQKLGERTNPVGASWPVQ
jgi:hypothetical protein